jgi:hypothetical protein
MTGKLKMLNSEFELWRILSRLSKYIEGFTIKGDKLASEFWGLRTLGKISIELCHAGFSIKMIEIFEEFNLHG